MGMFDYYQPSEKIFCPDCEIELGDWQGKDSICALLLWKQGQSFPESTLHDEEVEMSEEVRYTRRLPEKFLFYSSDCEKHRISVEGQTENEVWVSNRIVLVEDLEKKYALAKKRFARFQD